MLTTLFDLSYTYAYVSIDFALGFDMIYDMFDAPFHVSTLVVEFVVFTHIYRVCSILLISFQTWANLMILDIIYLEVTWLSSHHAVFNCNVRIVTLEILGGQILEQEEVYKLNTGYNHILYSF